MIGLIVKMMMRLQHIEYGSNLKIRGFTLFYARKGGRIKLGNNVTINSSFLSNLVGLYQRTIIVARDKDAEVNIGSRVGLSGVTIYAGTKVSIGDHTNIGGNTKILGYDFHPSDPDNRREGNNTAVGKDEIQIGKNCFIGCNCLILKGVHIGDEVTIGAGSVVVRDVPSRCVAAGNPAKVIKKY